MEEMSLKPQAGIEKNNSKTRLISSTSVAKTTALPSKLSVKCKAMPWKRKLWEYLIKRGFF